MIGAAAAYMSGLFFASFFIDPKGVLMYASAAVLIIIYGRRMKFTMTDLALIGGAFTAAVLVSTVYTSAVYRPAAGYAGHTGSFTGTVEDYVRYDGDRLSYTLSGRINGERRARVTYFSDDIGADFGDEVTLEGCAFEAPERDYLFDEVGTYRARHIELKAVRAEEVTVVQTDSRRLKKLLTRYRDSVIAGMRAETGSDCGSFLAGMVFGEKRYLESNTRSALYRTGIGHVLAVSGLHVSVIAALIMALLRAARVNRYVAFAVMNAFIIILTALANYPVSALRAAIMLDIMYSARLFLRQNDPLNSLAIAALLISVSDPYCVFNSGFLLSVAGTAGIAVFAPYMTAKMERETLPQRFLVTLVAAVCTTLSVFPLCLYYFDETSLVSPFTNMLLLPLCTAAMVLGLVYLLTLGLLPVLKTAAGLIKLILLISDGVSSVPAFHISDTSGLLWLISAVSAAAIAAVCMFRRSRRTVAAMTAGAVVLFTVSSAVTSAVRRNGFRAAVLGSGNNAAVVITHDGHTEIADLSGHYRSAEYVRKYLAANGISSPEMIMLTKNVQSVYSAYEKELALYPADSRIVTGDTQIYCGDALTAGDGALSVESSGCTMTYSSGELTVKYKGSEITFAPASQQSSGGGLTVYYGRLPSERVPERGALYTDENVDTDEVLTGMNCCEIVAARSGEYRIRRL